MHVMRKGRKSLMCHAVIVLVTMSAIVIGSLYLLSYNVVYAKAKVTPHLLVGWVVSNLSTWLLADVTERGYLPLRKIAVWLVTVIGGTLLCGRSTN